MLGLRNRQTPKFHSVGLSDHSRAKVALSHQSTSRPVPAISQIQYSAPACLHSLGQNRTDCQPMSQCWNSARTNASVLSRAFGSFSTGSLTNSTATFLVRHHPSRTMVGGSARNARSRAAAREAFLVKPPSVSLRELPPPGGEFLRGGGTTGLCPSTMHDYDPAGAVRPLRVSRPRPGGEGGLPPSRTPSAASLSPECCTAAREIVSPGSVTARFIDSIVQLRNDVSLSALER